MQCSTQLPSPQPPQRQQQQHQEHQHSSTHPPAATLTAIATGSATARATTTATQRAMQGHSSRSGSLQRCVFLNTEPHTVFLEGRPWLVSPPPPHILIAKFIVQNKGGPWEGRNAERCLAPFTFTVTKGNMRQPRGVFANALAAFWCAWCSYRRHQVINSITVTTKEHSLQTLALKRISQRVGHHVLNETSYLRSARASQ